MLRSSIRSLLSITFLSISVLAYAQDASFDSDESYTDAREMNAIAGGIFYERGFNLLDGPNPNPSAWAPTYEQLRAGCTPMTPDVVMPVVGEIVGEVELSMVLARVPNSHNPRLFRLVVVGTSLTGNRVEAGSISLHPLSFGFKKDAKTDSAGAISFQHHRLQNIKIPGRNSEPLLNVRIEICDSIPNFYALLPTFTQANIYLRIAQ